MKIHYTIDLPKNKPCWEVNGELWKEFSVDFYQRYKRYPDKNHIYTEQYVVQLYDLDESQMEQK